MSIINLIYLHSHDMGRYVGPYGFPMHTPNLQRFAAEGVLFRRAFAAAPTCSPSRAALLTGSTPHQNGQFGLTNQGWGLRDPNWHLARYLKRHGFHTLSVSNDHVHEPPVGKASDIWDEVHNHECMPEYDRWQTAAQAVARIQQGLPEPFFMAVGWDVTHRSKWEMVEEYTRGTRGAVDGRYATPFSIYADTPETRREAALQARSVEYLDTQVGLVLNAVEEAGLAERTLVIFATDHGPGQPDMKKDLLDFGTGTALMLRGPGIYSGGRVVDALVHQTDVYPTVCETFGLPVPAWVTGRSWLPLLSGKADAVHEAIFTEQNYHGSATPLRAVRTERWKYIRHFGPPQTYRHYSVDHGLVQAQWKQWGRSDLPYPEEQLYDLYLDPLERHNVVSESSRQAVLAALRAQLDTWMRETGDVLPAGPLPPVPLSETDQSYSTRSVRT